MTGREKLSKLLEFIKTLPQDRIDMETFADDGFAPDHCGTKACFGGWATVIFPELTLERDEYGMFVKYLSLEGFDALADFFELSEDGAYDVFGGCESTKLAIENFEHFVSNLTR